MRNRNAVFVSLVKLMPEKAVHKSNLNPDHANIKQRQAGGICHVPLRSPCSESVVPRVTHPGTLPSGRRPGDVLLPEMGRTPLQPICPRSSAWASFSTPSSTVRRAGVSPICTITRRMQASHGFTFGTGRRSGRQGNRSGISHQLRNRSATGGF